MYRAKDHIKIKVILFSTTQEQLDYLRFLSEIDKSETRAIAEKLNLNVANKPTAKIFVLFLMEIMPQ